jgi:photoactive yellow protein
MIAFSHPDIFAALQDLPSERVNRLSFGVVGLDAYGLVSRYNAVESSWSGLRSVQVLGHHFFLEIAPHFNNQMVAGQFETAHKRQVPLDIEMEWPNGDCIPRISGLDFSVKLRLLAKPRMPARYLLIQRVHQGSLVGMAQ